MLTERQGLSFRRERLRAVLGAGAPQPLEKCLPSRSPGCSSGARLQSHLLSDSLARLRSCLGSDSLVADVLGLSTLCLERARCRHLRLLGPTVSVGIAVEG